MRVFLDEVSLTPGGDPQAAMETAMESSHVAVQLLSEDLFSRTATNEELMLLLRRHRRCRLKLLPVFLRLNP